MIYIQTREVGRVYYDTDTMSEIEDVITYFSSQYYYNALFTYVIDWDFESRYWVLREIETL